MLSRRSFVSAAAGATGTLIGGGAAQAQIAKSLAPPVSQVASEFLYFDDPVEEFRAHMRIERDLVEDQGTTLTWYHWMAFVIPGGRRPEPLVRYEGIEYSHRGPAHLSIGQESAAVGTCDLDHRSNLLILY